MNCRCDFCDMWYHPECLGLDEKQAKSLTESDSWMCPECEDKKRSSKARGRPKKQDTSKRVSTESDGKKSKKAAPKGKSQTKVKAPLKKQISKEYISANDTSDSEEEISKRQGKSSKGQGYDEDSERKKKVLSVSDSVSDTDDDEAKDTAGIIRIPIEVSHLSNSNSSSETD